MAQKSAFLTNLDNNISQQKIILQPINISQDKIVSKTSYYQLSQFSNSGRQFSVSRSSSRHRNSNKPYLNVQSTTTRVEQASSQGFRKVGNVSLDNQILETQVRYQSQPRSTRPDTKEQGSKKKSKTNHVHKSPYYSTVYSYKGNTYNKVVFHKTSYGFRSKNTSPRNLSTSPLNSTFIRKPTNITNRPSTNQKPQQQQVLDKTLRMTIHHDQDPIKEANSVQENESRKQSKSVLLPGEKMQTADPQVVRQSLSSVDKYNTKDQDQPSNTRADLDTQTIKDLPNPNESIGQSYDLKNKSIA